MPEPYFGETFAVCIMYDKPAEAIWLWNNVLLDPLATEYMHRQEGVAGFTTVVAKHYDRSKSLTTEKPRFPGENSQEISTNSEVLRR